MRDIIPFFNVYLLIDTSCTFDAGWETMGFLSDETGTNVDWSGVFRINYDTGTEAFNVHNDIVDFFTECWYF